MVAAARAAGADELSALRVPVLLFGVAALLKAMLYAMLSPEVEANASREEQGHGGEGGEGDGKGGGVRARLCGVDVGLRPESLPVVLLLRPWNPLRDLP